MVDRIQEAYSEYATDRLAGGFDEMGSWPLVFPYVRHKKCLDVGCADGLYLRHLSGTSVGIEQIPDLVGRARARGLQVVRADVMRGLSQQESETYEAVLFSHVMEHLEAPLSALKEIHRVLATEGILVLGLPVENCFIRHVFRMDYFDGTHLYAFTIRNARKLLFLAGFRVERVIFHFLPRFKGRFGVSLNKVWNVVPLPFKEYFSMGYWIVAVKAPAPSRDGLPRAE